MENMFRDLKKRGSFFLTRMVVSLCLYTKREEPKKNEKQLYCICNH